MVGRSTHTNECDTSRYEGYVVMFDKDKGFGFIKPDYHKSGNDIFFGRKNLTTKGLLPKDGDRVQFCVIKTSDGRYEAKDILVQVNFFVDFSLDLLGSFISPILLLFDSVGGADERRGK